jgi:hypothetical protein
VAVFHRASCTPALNHAAHSHAAAAARFPLSVPPCRWQIWLSAAAATLLQIMHRWEVGIICRMLHRVSAIGEPVQFIGSLLQVRMQIDSGCIHFLTAFPRTTCNYRELF